MENKTTRNFRIQVWFSGLPDKFLLGTVSVYSQTEAGALDLAKAHTEYFVSGVDETSWQVREPRMVYI